MSCDIQQPNGLQSLGPALKCPGVQMSIIVAVQELYGDVAGARCSAKEVGSS